MSLNWSIKKVENVQEIIDDPDEAVITEAIVWSTIAVGFGEITEKNAQEFYARLSVYEQLYGTMLQAEGKEIPLTPENISRRIGLHTNVFPNKTETQWKKGLTDRALADARRVFDKATKKEKVSA